MASIPWTEKYRAQSLHQICSQPFISRLKYQVADIGNQTICHFLFHGLPGCGKTSSAQAICKDLFGPKVYPERVRELNANEENGIGLVRDQVKYFASLKIGKRVMTDKHTCPDIKVIIIDEADALTPDAQAALRHIIENSSKTTRFMFICNDISRISDALISRCFIYRFNKINHLDMYDKLSEICNKERMGCESRERYDSLMQQIISHADGDMRKAINVLQGCCQNGHLEAEMLHNITGSMTQMQHDDLFSKIRQLDDGNGLHYLTEKLLKCGVDASKLLDEIILFMIKDEQFVALNVVASRRQQLFFRMMYLTSRLHHGCDQYLIVWHAVSMINYEMIASERVDV